MESQIVEVGLPNGSTALARVAMPESASAEGFTDLPEFNFQDVSDTVEGIAAALKTGLDRVAPDKVSVELGLEIAAKAGKLTALLVEGEGKGSLTVTLEWEGSGAAE